MAVTRSNVGDAPMLPELLNRYTALGIPVTVPIGEARPGKGETCTSNDLCNKAECDNHRIVNSPQKSRKPFFDFFPAKEVIFPKAFFIQLHVGIRGEKSHLPSQGKVNSRTKKKHTEISAGSVQGLISSASDAQGYGWTPPHFPVAPRGR